MKKQTTSTKASKAAAAETLYGEAILRCPRCSIAMKKLKNRATIIDVCDSCGGMWLDKGEIEKLAALHPGRN